MGGHTKKQFRPLAGKQLLVHTIERVLAAPEVRWLVVAVPETHLDSTDEMLSALLPPKVELLVTVGGATRQKSVANALLEVPVEAQLITVHDAARPCLDPAWILPVQWWQGPPTSQMMDNFQPSACW